MNIQFPFNILLIDYHQVDLFFTFIVHRDFGVSRGSSY